MNKKGVFFTVMVLLILTMFLVSYSIVSGVEKRKTTEKRIETMNSFLSSVEEDLERQLFISGFRSIFLVESRILETGSYMQNLNYTFQEIFFNGTIGGQETEQSQLLMNGATFSDINEIINDRAEKVNVEINISNPALEVSHDSAWTVKFTLRANLSMRDKAGLASWDKEEGINALIPITGFEDPLYVISTGGATSNTIAKTPYSPMSLQNMVDHATGTYYMNTSESPSFLDRLQGNIAAQSPYGIESMAVPKLTSISGRSIVDHQYFAGVSGQQVPSLPAWFILDPVHCDLYPVPC